MERPVLTEELFREAFERLERPRMFVTRTEQEQYKRLAEDLIYLVFQHKVPSENLVDELLGLTYWQSRVRSKNKMISRFQKSKRLRFDDFEGLVSGIVEAANERLEHFEFLWIREFNISPKLKMGAVVEFPSGEKVRVKEVEPHYPAYYRVASLEQGEYRLYKFEELEQIAFRQIDRAIENLAKASSRNEYRYKVGV